MGVRKQQLSDLAWKTGLGLWLWWAPWLRGWHRTTVMEAICITETCQARVRYWCYCSNLFHTRHQEIIRLIVTVAEVKGPGQHWASHNKSPRDSTIEFALVVGSQATMSQFRWFWIGWLDITCYLKKKKTNNYHLIAADSHAKTGNHWVAGTLPRVQRTHTGNVWFPLPRTGWSSSLASQSFLLVVLGMDEMKECEVPSV